VLPTRMAAQSRVYTSEAKTKTKNTGRSLYC
jgi:hypothetical protein